MPRNSARIGAGLFLLSMALGGPQALGVASADTDDSAASSVSESSGTDHARASRGPKIRMSSNADTRSESDAGQVAAPRRPSAAAARSAAALGPQTAVSTEEPARHASEPTRPEIDTTPASTPDHPREASTATATALVRDAAAPVATPTAAVTIADATPAPNVTANDSPPAPATVLTPLTSTAPTPAAYATASPAAVVQAFRGVLDSAANWVSGLPAGPVTDFLDGAILLVRRTLFNEAPVAKPPRASGPANTLIVGSLDAIDPEGDPIVYTVTQDPQHGTVALAANGTYTYTPAQGFNGIDKFSVSVTDTGWHVNLLAPFLAPPADVVVTLSVGNVPAQVSPGEAYPGYVPPEGCACQTTWSYNGQVFTGGLSLDMSVGILGA